MSLSLYLRSNSLWGMQGIVDLDFRGIAIATESAGGAVGLGERHDEVVNAAETALDFLARSGGDGHGGGGSAASAATSAAATAGHHPVILERFRIGVFGGYAFQIAGHGVAGSASGFEVGFAGLGIADENAGRHHARDVITTDLEAVDVSGDVGNLSGGEIEGWAFRRGLSGRRG